MPEEKNKLLYEELSYKLRGIFFEIQNELGTKFQEKHYCRAIATLLKKNNISFKQEAPFTVIYEGNVLGKFNADFIVEDKIILEIKTTNEITNDNVKQLIRYLEAANLQLGLFVNFRVRPLEIRRVINKNP